MVRRFADLATMVARFALLSEAGLRADMAKRIMYSILPGVASPTQTMATQGVVDYKALKAAVEGRKDIIKYGVNAAVKELRHYEGDLSVAELGAPAALAKGKPYHLARAYANQGDNEKAMDIAIKMFGDKEAWPPAHGGEAWLAIAKTVKSIVVLDKNLEDVRASRGTDPGYMDKELTIMQQLIIAMNVFDGLSHNTASILSNMVEEEALVMHPGASTPELNDLTSKEFQTIQHMMDAKELRNPTQVFREIEPALVGSGDINRYKDWVSLLHRDPTYRAHDPNLDNEKFLIRFRKQIHPFRSTINSRRDHMRKTLEKVLSSGPQSYLIIYRGLDNMLEEFANLVDRILEMIDEQYITPREDADMQISDEIRTGIAAKLRDGISKISMDARLKVETARIALDPITQKYKQQKQKGVVSEKTLHEFQTAIYNIMKGVYEGYGSLSFYLDSI